MKNLVVQNYKTYPSYKDTGIEWLGDIPEGWELRRLKYISEIDRFILSENSPKNVIMKYIDIGNVTYEKGIINYEEFSFRDSPSRARKLVKSGDTVISNVRTYLKAIDYIDNVKKNYVFSTGFSILSPRENIYNKFLFNTTKSNFITDQVMIFSKGMSYPAINKGNLSSIIYPIPPISEQRAIADFLDEKTSKIDKAIDQKTRLITLLKERKQILIQDAVTKGVPGQNPHRKTKDSGVEWIGEIPENWEVRKAKNIFYEINERSLTGDEELLSVSHISGVTPRSEKEVNMFLAADYSGSKLCKRGDLVINIMWAWMGALGFSKKTGIVSPSYGVFRAKNLNAIDVIFMEHKLKSTEYLSYYNKVSTGLHASRLRFYPDMFLNMKLQIPPIDEQKQIVEYIETESAKIDKAVVLQEKQIVKLKEYKSVLIDSAVSGKIKVA